MQLDLVKYESTDAGKLQWVDVSIGFIGVSMVWGVVVSLMPVPIWGSNEFRFIGKHISFKTSFRVGKEEAL